MKGVFILKKIIVKKHGNYVFDFKTIDSLQPTEDSAVVKVQAFSLNPGDVQYALQAPDGFTPGWDFSGIVAESSLNGEGPKKGDKVIGVLPYGAWQEQLLVSNKQLAVVPDTLDLVKATTG